MRNFIQEGDTITLTAPAAVKSGDVVVVGSLVGIAAYDAAQGAQVETAVEGVFELPKVAGAIAQGVKVYWTGSAVSAAASGTLLGAAVAAAGASDATVKVRLNGVAV